MIKALNFSFKKLNSSTLLLPNFIFQIDYGDCASTPNAEVVAKDALRRFCCRRFIVDTLPQDLDLLESRLLHKWQSYHKISPQKCSRMLLCLLQDTWEFFGSSIFSCRDLYGTLVQRNANVWLAVNENGVSLLGSTMVSTFHKVIHYYCSFIIERDCFLFV